MSSLTVNGTSSLLYPLLGGSQNQAASGIPTDGVNPLLDPLEQETGSSDSAGGAGGIGGHRHATNGALFQALAESVTGALQSAQSDGDSDPNQIVEQAIAKVLQQNGSSTAGAITDNTSGTAGGTSSSTSTPQAFFQALQENGIDPQQFHSDFLTAIQQAQSGAGDPATAFSSFPPGLTLDTTG